MGSSMSTKPCKACVTQIDEEATVCPHCRAKQGMGFFRKLGIGFVGLVIIGSLASKDDDKKASPTPEQLAAEAKSRELRAKMTDVIEAIKNSRKDPDSFKDAKAGVTLDGITCVTFRATNSFNAIVPGIAYEKGGKIMQDEQGFKKHCKKPMLMTHELY
jgi:RNA polymerase subunit RPABC4/transcription elongation factor Spt4